MSILTTTHSDLTAEQGFLSTCSKNANNLHDAIDEGFEADWLTYPFHQKIWENMFKVRDSEVIDVDTMLEFVDAQDRTECQHILSMCETGTSFHSYLNRVKEEMQKRKVRKLALGVLDNLDGNMEAKNVVELADRELTKISVNNSDTIRSSKEVVNSMWESIQKRMEVGGMSGIASGINRLDQMTYGWQNGDLIVVAARTSVGKTAFGCEMALNATKHNKNVLFFSLEMKAEAVMQRLVSNASGVPLGYIIDKTAREEDIQLYQEGMNFMASKNFWVDDRGMINSAQVRAKARKFARKGLDLIVVDYAQKMAPVDARIPREQQVAEIAGSMKALAMELDIPVILLSQLNRGADELNRKPRISDIRESGAIEQDADIVALLWRKNDDPAQTIVSISKQRQGRCGDVEVLFEPKIQRFSPRPSLN